MGLSGTARTRLIFNPRRCVRAEPAVAGDERVEIKEILKIMVSGTAKSAKKCKMVMLRNGFLEICENDMLRNGNSRLKMGVSLAAHTQYAVIWKYPPPPGGGGGQDFLSKPFDSQVKIVIGHFKGGLSEE